MFQTDDAFLAWLAANVEVVENGTACYRGFPITPATRVTRYQVVISLLVVSFRIPTRLHVVGYDAGLSKAIGCSLLSFVCGWWGIPWGIFWTVWYIGSNILGGESQSVADIIAEITGHRRRVMDLSEDAVAQINRLRVHSGYPKQTAIRVIPDGRGKTCQVQFDVPEPDDRQWAFCSHGVTVLVDKRDADQLAGRFLDYQNDEFTIREASESREAVGETR